MSVAKYTNITGQPRSQLGTEFKHRYESGASIRALARTSGRSYGFVRTVLTEAGTRLRARGGANREHTATTDTRAPRASAEPPTHVPDFCSAMAASMRIPCPTTHSSTAMRFAAPWAGLSLMSWIMAMSAAASSAVFPMGRMLAADLDNPLSMP